MTVAATTEEPVIVTETTAGPTETTTAEAVTIAATTEEPVIVTETTAGPTETTTVEAVTIAATTEEPIIVVETTAGPTTTEEPEVVAETTTAVPTTTEEPVVATETTTVEPVTEATTVRLVSIPSISRTTTAEETTIATTTEDPVDVETTTVEPTTVPTTTAEPTETTTVTTTSEPTETTTPEVTTATTTSEAVIPPIALSPLANSTTTEAPTTEPTTTETPGSGGIFLPLAVAGIDPATTTPRPRGPFWGLPGLASPHLRTGGMTGLGGRFSFGNPLGGNSALMRTLMSGSSTTLPPVEPAPAVVESTDRPRVGGRTDPFISPDTRGMLESMARNGASLTPMTRIALGLDPFPQPGPRLSETPRAEELLESSEPGFTSSEMQTMIDNIASARHVQMPPRRFEPMPDIPRMPLRQPVPPPVRPPVVVPNVPVRVPQQTNFVSQLAARAARGALRLPRWR